MKPAAIFCLFMTYLAGAVPCFAQAAGMVGYYPTVTALAASMTDLHLTNSLVVGGFYAENDGGGGVFSNGGTSCTFTASVTTASGSSQVEVTSYTAGITINMVILSDSQGYFTGATVTGLGTPGDPHSIVLSASAPATASDTLTFRCDNGGTIIKDSATTNSTFWRRTTTTHSVLEWGARCDNSHDDTTAIQNAEAIAEQVGDNIAVPPPPTTNGQAGTLTFPAGRTCLAKQIIIQQAVSWISSGTKQAWIGIHPSGTGYPIAVAPAGSLGNAFIAIGLSLFNTMNCGMDPAVKNSPAQVTFKNIGINGINNNNNVMGIGIEAAPNLCVPGATWVYFSNVAISNFTNHLLYSYKLPGLIRAYNLILWYNGATSSTPTIGNFAPSCMVLDTINNPIRFYNLVTAECYNDGTVLNAVDGAMFDGFTSFGNGNAGFSLTGTPNGGSGSGRAAASVAIFNGESNNNGGSNFYIDPVGGTETVICHWCRSQKGGQSPASIASDLEIGPDATNLAWIGDPFLFTDITTGALSGAKQQNYNVGFDSNTCAATVSLQGMIAGSISQVISNLPQCITGPAYLEGAPPVFDGNPMNGTPGWANGIVVPQGRLTLSQSTPVMTTDVIAGTTIYYTDMVGQHVPIYNGSNLAAHNIHAYFLQTVGNAAMCSSGCSLTNVGDVFGLPFGASVNGPGVSGGATVTSVSLGGVPVTTMAGTTAIGSRVVTGFSSTVLLKPGMGVSSTVCCTFPVGTYITSVDSSSQITVSQPAATAGSVSLNFTTGATVGITGSLSATATGPVTFSATTGDLQLPLDSNSGDIGYQHASNLYDVFVALNPADSVPILCTGPNWTTTAAGSSTRGGASQPSNIRSFMGIWVNRNAITCRYATGATATVQCPAKQCTYVGTMLATADGQATMAMNAPAGAGGAIACLCIYNAYNQTQLTATSRDSSAQYTYNVGSWRALNGSGWTLNAPSNPVAYVDGLAQSVPHALLTDVMQYSGPTLQEIGIDFNAATATPKLIALNQNTLLTSVTLEGTTGAILGLNYAQAVENGGSVDAISSKFGNGAGYEALTLHIQD